MFPQATHGWASIAALISSYNPIGILVTSIILAGIQTGGAAIARSTSVPLEISSIIQGCITLFISAKIIIQIRRRQKAKAATEATAGGTPAQGNMEGGAQA
jgi:simple sugar transport system permease protein